MKRALLLRIAAALSLVTCIGHTIGTFMAIPPEQTQMHATIATMKATMVPMPVGSPRSYMELLDGNNICTSIGLFLCAALLAAVAGAAKGRVVDRVVALTALALAGISLISFRYFFPVPAVFTGLAAVLAMVARARATLSRPGNFAHAAGARAPHPPGAQHSPGSARRRLSGFYPAFWATSPKRRWRWL